MQSTDKQALLLHRQVAMLFNAIPYSAVTNLTGGFLTLLLFRDVLPPIQVYPWVSLVMGITLIRLVMYRRYLQANPSPQQVQSWYERFRISALLLSGVLGSAGFVLFVDHNTIYQLVLALMIVCIAAFAITSLAPSGELVKVFLVLLMGPMTGTFVLAYQDNIASYTVWMIPLTMAMLLLSSHRISNTIASNILLTIEAQQRELELRNSQQRIALYVQESPLAVLEWDRQRIVQQWNPAAERLFGYTKAEAIGRSLTSLILTSSASEQLQEAWGKLERETGGEQLILENHNKQGTLLQCEWFNAALHGSEGAKAGVVSLIQDVTARVEAERMKQEFVSIVSHELRTPVTSIKGSLGLLASGVLVDDPAETQSMLDIALQNTNRLQLLINDILDVQKLEAGRMEYRFQDADLVALIHQVITATEGAAQQYHVTMQAVDLPSTCVLSMDPDRITQVLTNLLSNAIKFSETHGTVMVALRVGPEGATVSVNNRGEVIPPADRARMFKKFSQRDSSATRAKGGTGLGLYICQCILDVHHSKLDFTSDLDSGTTFFFTMPLIR